MVHSEALDFTMWFILSKVSPMKMRMAKSPSPKASGVRKRFIM